MLTIRVSKTRARRVPLSDRAFTVLGHWLRRRGVGPGGIGNRGDPYSPVNAAVLRHSRDALRCHALRRSFAVRWLESGGSEVGLMRIAGWSSLSMVKKYSAASADRLAEQELRRIIE